MPVSRASASSGRGALASAHIPRLAQAHQSQGRSNDCGPFAAAILLNAIVGTGLDGSCLAREMDRPRWSGIVPVVRRLPRHATFPWGLADVLREHGLAATWRLLADERDLLRAISDGDIAIPVIGEWRRRWAHYVILVAHEDERGYGFVDPARSSGAAVWIARPEFCRLWRAYGRTAVFAHPRPLVTTPSPGELA